MRTHVELGHASVNGGRHNDDAMRLGGSEPKISGRTRGFRCWFATPTTSPGWTEARASARRLLLREPDGQQPRHPFLRAVFDRVAYGWEGFWEVKKSGKEHTGEGIFCELYGALA